MADLSNHQSSTTTKILVVGESSSGKTGALASLADAGYNLRIIDLDNGLDILSNMFRPGPNGEKPKYNPEGLARIKYKTFTEDMKLMGGDPVPTSAKVWRAVMNFLENWSDGDEKLGPVTTWGPNDILVIDSFTMLSNAALWFIQALNGRLGKSGGFDGQRDVGEAQARLEHFLQWMYSTAVKCNVVCISHVVYTNDFGQSPNRETKEDFSKAFPSAIGKALSPRIPRYFNTVLEVRTVGQGPGAQKRIFTKSQGMLELKTTNPGNVKDFYSLETGLAEYFKAVRGK